MPTAGQVASELRRVADALDREPEAEVHRPILGFYPDKKEYFLNLAKLLPRPLKKSGQDYIVLESVTDTFILRAEIAREKVCEVVEPAKPAVYRCDPLLSPEEEATLEEATLVDG